MKQRPLRLKQEGRERGTLQSNFHFARRVAYRHVDDNTSTPAAPDWCIPTKEDDSLRIADEVNVDRSRQQPQRAVGPQSKRKHAPKNGRERTAGRAGQQEGRGVRRRQFALVRMV